jgi:two-component system response regulator HydG
VALKKYHWPGNIRELENVIEHAFIIESGNRLSLVGLPEKITGVPSDALPQLQGEEDGPPPTPEELLDFNMQKELFEKEFIIRALKTFKGRINQTALHANIPKKTLLRKIEKYGIVAREYSNPKA